MGTIPHNSFSIQLPSLLILRPSKREREREKRKNPSNQYKLLEPSSAMDVPTSWDSLRKQARILEAQLDEQMVSYRKFVSAKADTGDNNIQSGIEQLLKQLDQVNNQMRAWVSSGGSEMVSHTLTRHQEILQDLTQEFYRLRSSLKAKQEHASLLQDFREFDLNKLDLEEGGNLEERVLLKEHATISRNTGQLDSVISQAQSTLGTLVFQRLTFGGINSKISNVSSRLPTGKCTEKVMEIGEDPSPQSPPPSPPPVTYQHLLSSAPRALTSDMLYPIDYSFSRLDIVPKHLDICFIRVPQVSFEHSIITHVAFAHK
ncbi:hypothetical protein KSS87_013259, partial [Heliosperma pusillum]